MSANQSTNGLNRETHHCSDHYAIRYMWLVILIISIISIIAIVDRFTINVFPSSMKNVSPFDKEISDDEWLASIFFALGFITGRILTATSALMFVLQCRCFWNFFVEYIKPKWMKIDDIIIENNKIHYYLGYIGVGIPCIIHCFALFLPLLSPNISFRFYNEWHRPSDIGFYYNYYINMSFQDINGFVIVSLCFCILFPISMYYKLRDLHWSVSQYVHVFGAVIYTVELLRIEFKNNCYYCTFPFVVLYIIDRVIFSIFIYRKNNLILVSKYKFDHDYTLFLFNIEHADNNKHFYSKYIGNVYYINFKSDMFRFKHSHPYTVFYNHPFINHNGNQMSNDVLFHDIMPLDRHDRRLSAPNHKFPISQTGVMHRVSRLPEIDEDLRSDYKAPIQIVAGVTLTPIDTKRTAISSQVDEASRNSPSVVVFTFNVDVTSKCDIGIIMHTNDNDKNKYLFSKKMFNLKPDERFNIIGYGPYRASFSMICEELNDNYPLLLVGTGAGISYIIDFYLYIIANDVTLDETIEIYVLCRSPRLFQWVTDILCKKAIHNLEIYAHLTSNPDIKSSQTDDKNKTTHAKIGRASFEDVFRNSKPNTRVFFCGSPQLQKKVAQYCKQFGYKLHQGHTFY